MNVEGVAAVKMVGSGEVKDAEEEDGEGRTVRVYGDAETGVRIRGQGAEVEVNWRWMMQQAWANKSRTHTRRAMQ